MAAAPATNTMAPAPAEATPAPAAPAKASSENNTLNYAAGAFLVILTGLAITRR
jgi:hypothetical protein